MELNENDRTDLDFINDNKQNIDHDAQAIQGFTVIYGIYQNIAIFK